MERKLLAEALRQRVWILGADVRRLVRREMVGDAVAGGRRGVKEPLHARRFRCLEDGERAVDVRMEIILGPLDARHDIRKRRHVEDPVDAREQRRDPFVVADIGLDDREMRIPFVMREVLEPPRAAVVDDDDILPLCEQAVDDMRPDKAATAGDDGFHKCTPLFFNRYTAA